MSETSRRRPQGPEPNPAPWWRATLIATFVWLCVAYLIGNQCGSMGLIGPCKMVMYASRITAYMGIAWVAMAIFFIPILALVALVKTYQRAVRPLPPERLEAPQEP
jgi:hypothetical protein